MNGVWQKAGDRIRDALGQVGYETWIGPLTFVGLQDKTATIEAPNRFFREWVNDRYLDLIRQTISAEVGEPVEIKLTLGQDSNGDGHGNGHAKTSGNRCCGNSSSVGRSRTPRTSSASQPALHLR